MPLAWLCTVRVLRPLMVSQTCTAASLLLASALVTARWLPSGDHDQPLAVSGPTYGTGTRGFCVRFPVAGFQTCTEYPKLLSKAMYLLSDGQTGDPSTP